MPRKKVERGNKTTLTTELPHDAIKDISGADIEPDEDLNLKMGQTEAALEPTKKTETKTENKVRPALDRAQYLECVNFLNDYGLSPVWGAASGGKVTCYIVDDEGNSVMPFDAMRNRSAMAFGDDKDRALLNAVNGCKDHVIEVYELDEEEEDGTELYPQILPDAIEKANQQKFKEALGSAMEHQKTLLPKLAEYERKSGELETTIMLCLKEMIIREVQAQLKSQPKPLSVKELKIIKLQEMIRSLQDE